MPSHSIVIARSQTKQSLKDAFRRLKRIRVTCGEKDEDDDDVKTKDPLLICIANFERRIGDAEELLLLPPDQIFSDQDKLHLRRAVLGAQQELKTMEDMLVSADAKYNTAVLKKKSGEKVVALESDRDRCKKAFDQAEETLNDLKKTQDERERQQMELLTKGGRVKPKPEDMPHASSREPIASIDGGASQKKTMKKAMDILARSQGVVDDEEAAAAEGVDTSAYQWDPTVTLAAEASTKQQAVRIQQQKREVQVSLARIHDGVTRLHEMSKMMAAEIEDQNRRIEKLDQVVEQRQQKLQDLNEKIEKLNESMKPLNCCFNVLCFLILLAIVGFLLYYYDVVSVDGF